MIDIKQTLSSCCSLLIFFFAPSLCLTSSFDAICCYNIFVDNSNFKPSWGIVRLETASCSLFLLLSQTWNVVIAFSISKKKQTNKNTHNHMIFMKIWCLYIWTSRCWKDFQHQTQFLEPDLCNQHHANVFIIQHTDEKYKNLSLAYFRWIVSSVCFVY